MNILGLDTGTQLGWALARDAGAPPPEGREAVVTDTLDLRRGVGSEGADAGSRWAMLDFYLRWLNAKVRREAVGIIAVEQAILGLSGYEANVVRVAQVEAAGLVAFWRGAELEIVNPGTLRKFATGNGKATNRQMVQAARIARPDVDFRTDHEADALLLVELVKERRGRRALTLVP